ncbi:unnamed protein product [Didymodactylos carnosus]|uniref:Tetratricopeptide repeat protein n=1 Tax=Didymodactylos carnosus TaxID=1234261 RepID=A0A8S2IM19_9BILA|nr:unnamed protein product [Didymodactylos carnosus]CAF3759042.1 unnamed protein product [Didymodactylos carnosus]
MKIFHLLVNICRYLCEKWFSIGNENVKEEYVKYPHPELKRKLSRTRSITVYGYKPLLLSTFLSILFLFLSVIIAIGFSYLPLFIARLSSNRDLLTLNTSSSSTNKDSTTHSLSLLSTTHVFFPASSGKSYYEQHSPSEIYKQQNDLQIQQHEDQKYFSGGKPKKNISNDLRLEAETSLHLALRFVAEGKLDKARRLFEHSLTLDPLNSEILVEYGQFLEKHHNDLLQAEHYYSRALTTHPTHRRALENKRRCLPLVEEIDQKAFQFIDQLLTEFYRIPDTNPYLRRAKRDAYYLHIYHSNAIEGKITSAKVVFQR